jgi:hypothetical protein
MSSANRRIKGCASARAFEFEGGIAGVKPQLDSGKILLAWTRGFCIVSSPEQLLDSRKDDEHGTQS